MDFRKLELKLYLVAGLYQVFSANLCIKALSSCSGWVGLAARSVSVISKRLHVGSYCFTGSWRTIFSSIRHVVWRGSLLLPKKNNEELLLEACRKHKVKHSTVKHSIDTGFFQKPFFFQKPSERKLFSHSYDITAVQSTNIACVERRQGLLWLTPCAARYKLAPQYAISRLKTTDFFGGEGLSLPQTLPPLASHTWK